MNPILMTDSYKVSHWLQYPPGTEHVYSYFESRGGVYPSTVFFGLQYILDKHLKWGFDWYDIQEAQEYCEAHFGTHKLFNMSGWMSLMAKHKGNLPIRIKAVPEGTVVPTGNALMTVENTDPEFPWLTNYFETILSQVWYPTTVATVSYHVKTIIMEYLLRTGTKEDIDFKLHDFGFRGSSSLETAAIGGAAHLVNFKGTDNLPPLLLLKRHYMADVAGFSIPASEHSTMTAWGRKNEVEAFRNMIKQYGDLPLYAVVSDSYNIYDACANLWGKELKQEVINANGTLVVRPDSGDPAHTTLRVLEILGTRFGYQVNSKGYRVLHPKVRVIWGDGLEPETIDSILGRMRNNGWSADNISFGMGGGLLQKVDRDTQMFAFKCSSVTINGEEKDVYKQPVGQEMKVSKSGRLGLYKDVFTGNVATLRQHNNRRRQNDLLETVFENGEVVKRYSLEEIRERINSNNLVMA